MRPVNPGDSIRKNLTSRVFNRLVKSSLEHKVPLPRNTTDQRTLVKIFNTTTTAIGRYEGFEVIDAIIPPTDNVETQPGFQYVDLTVAPIDSGTSEIGWGVAQTPVPGIVGASGVGCVSGITWAKFNKLSSAHNYVGPGSTELETTTRGRGEILVNATATRDFGLINLGVFACQTIFYIAEITEVFVDGVAEAEIKNLNGTSFTPAVTADITWVGPEVHCGVIGDEFLVIRQCNTGYYVIRSLVVDPPVTDLRYVDPDLQLKRGNCAWETWYTAQDCDTPTEAPGTFSINSVTSTTMSVTWTDESTNEDGFLIQIRETGDTVWIDWDLIDPNNTSAVITGLTASTQYDARVGAYNAYGTLFSNTDTDTTAVPEP